DKEDGHPLPRKLFLMKNYKRMVNTDAGEMRVLESYGRIHERRLHIGIIDMEPNSLFVPQYLDSTLILFVRSVSATVKFDKLRGNLVCVCVEFEENVELDLILNSNMVLEPPPRSVGPPAITFLIGPSTIYIRVSSSIPHWLRDD
ncbi:vicilin-like antimicrobial peptides 2-2-like, partial [Trifolium medium]|nr:vicilin-like antimicrobial peptides 2-2-like [Trifolium medium]